MGGVEPSPAGPWSGERKATAPPRLRRAAEVRVIACVHACVRASVHHLREVISQTADVPGLGQKLLLATPVGWWWWWWYRFAAPRARASLVSGRESQTASRPAAPVLLQTGSILSEEALLKQAFGSCQRLQNSTGP